MLEKLNSLYFDSFIDFWIPIYKKQVFECVAVNDTLALLEIRENIWKNIHFNKNQRDYVLRELGIFDRRTYG